MPLPTAFTIICPANDLKSLRILDLAHAFRSTSGAFSHRQCLPDIDIIVGPDIWGKNLDDARLRIWENDGRVSEPFISSDLLQRLRHDYLVVIELPSPWLIDRLRMRNPQLTVIEINDGSQLNGEGGSHDFGSSALHKFAKLIGYTPNTTDEIIATNDAHYLPGLFNLGLHKNVITQVRNTELHIRGICGLEGFSLDETPFVSASTINLFKQPASNCNFQQISDWWFGSQCGWSKNARAMRRYNDITFVNAPEKHAPVLMEVFHRKTSLEKADSELKLGNTLIFYFEESKYNAGSLEKLQLDDVVRLEFSGEAKYRSLLNRLVASALFRQIFHSQTGGSEQGTYCIAVAKGRNDGEPLPIRETPMRRRAIVQFVDALLTEVLTFSRPLRDYQGTFFLPLNFSDVGDNSHSIPKSIENNLAELGWQELRHTRYTLDEAKKVFTKQVSEDEQQSAELTHAERMAKAVAYKTKLYAQEYYYFEPQVRQFLYPFADNTDATAPHIRTWEYNPPRTAQVWHEHYLGRLCVPHNNDKQAPVIEAFISDVKLHLFAGHFFLLEINTKPICTAKGKATTNPAPREHNFPNWYTKSECENTNSDNFEPRHARSTDFDDDDWWLDMVFGDESTLRFYQQMQMGNWLRFSQVFRVLFTAYSAHAKEPNLENIDFFPADRPASAKIKNRETWKTDPASEQITEHTPEPDVDQIFIASPEESDKLLSPIIAYWLSKIVGEGAPNHNELLQNAIQNNHDDRLFSQLSYCPAGKAPESFTSQTLDPYFTFALYLDCDGFTAMDGFAYDPIFLETISTQQCYRRWQKNGTLSGFTDFSNVYMGYGWFYADIIAKEHFSHHYRRMLILSLFYRTSLRNDSRAIDEAARALADHPNSSNTAIEDLRKNFIGFTTKYWFENITAQIQGKELFALIKHNLGLQQEYDFIKEQMNWADGYLKDRHNKWMQKLANTMAAAAVFVALFAVGLDVLIFAMPTGFEQNYEFKAFSLLFLLLLWILICTFTLNQFIKNRSLHIIRWITVLALVVELLGVGYKVAAKYLCWSFFV
ncbi:hypothetical protein [Teredinibacter turnerae]|uniref:hypothetical protein n=1 Tax=Teredinibacter turnerae TaxID=2426 RepID=UPI000375D35E|nr:hypothetical protein [Teredinibacter turnerae]